MTTSIHFLRVLIHTADIWRPAIGASDTGEPTETWVKVHSGKRCRLVRKSETIAAGERSAERVLVDLLLTEPDTDLLPGDQVRNICWVNGNSYISETFEVETGLNRAGTSLHHRSFNLKRVGSE